MKALAFVALVLAGCVAQPKMMDAELYDRALNASLKEAQQEAAAGKLQTMRGFISEIYLRLQRRIPDLPAPIHVWWRELIAQAPQIDAKKITVYEAMNAADLKQLEAQRIWRETVDAQYAAAWAAAFRAASQSFQPAPRLQTNCTTNTIGRYTYTNCY